MSIADKFASERALTLSSSYRTIAEKKLSASLQHFATIPMEQRLAALHNDRLLWPITEAEVLLAAHGLSRHKAASEGGFNNIFYTDTATLLMPALVIISKEILNGANMSPLFLAALIIPPRKKGDSDVAMDYRFTTNQLQGVC